MNTIPLTYRPAPPDVRRRWRVRLRITVLRETRVILPLVLLIALALLGLTLSNSLRVEALARGRQAINSANPSAGPSERAAAAGDYGVVLNLNTPDGCWIVMRYEPVPDREVGVTLALDSGGRWYVNEEFRLGQLRYGTLSPVEDCETLAEAREKLRQLGFRVTSP